MEKLCHLSLAELSPLVRQCLVSPVAIVEQLLERIEALDPRLNAFVTVTADRALDRAAEAEREIARGFWRGPLHGLPFGAKDLLASGAVPAEVGMPIFRGRTTARPATAIARLEAAGAILLGKLRQTEGTLSGYHPDDPVPQSPWGADRFPGASSSGSGVALAARLCPAAQSSDTGGSIRTPSALGGLTGLMPSWGRVSLDGAFPLAPSMDVIGPMARSAEDCAMLLGAIAGHDSHDPTAAPVPVPDYRAEIGRPVAGLVVGMLSSACSQVDPDVADALDRCRSVLEAQGVRFETVDFPIDEDAMTAWIDLCLAEAALSYEREFLIHGDRFGPALRSAILDGRSVSAAALIRANQARRQVTRTMRALFSRIDALLVPALPVAAIPLAPDMPQPGMREAYSPGGRFLGCFNLTGQPTITFPAGMTGNGDPVGVQLAGWRWQESMLLRIAHAFQQRSDWHRACPPDMP